MKGAPLIARPGFLLKPRQAIFPDSPSDFLSLQEQLSEVAGGARQVGKSGGNLQTPSYHLVEMAEAGKEKLEDISQRPLLLH